MNLPPTFELGIPPPLLPARPVVVLRCAALVGTCFPPPIGSPTAESVDPGSLALLLLLSLGSPASTLGSRSSHPVGKCHVAILSHSFYWLAISTPIIDSVRQSPSLVLPPVVGRDEASPALGRW